MSKYELTDEQILPWSELLDGRKSLEHLIGLADADTPHLGEVVAALLSVAKWHPSRNVRGGKQFCGLCYQYARINPHSRLPFPGKHRWPGGYEIGHGCMNCPLYKMGKPCVDSEDGETAFEQWLDSLSWSTPEFGKELEDEIYQDLLQVYGQLYEQYADEIASVEWESRDA